MMILKQLSFEEKDYCLFHLKCNLISTILLTQKKMKKLALALVAIFEWIIGLDELIENRDKSPVFKVFLDTLS
jgi:hypothetical protein